MEEKRSEINSSKINQGSDPNQKVKTTVEFPEDGKKLFAIHSERWFSRNEFLGKSGILFRLAALAIIVLWIGIPFFIQLAIADLNIPPIISIAIILLVSKTINFLFGISLIVKLVTCKSMFSWGVALFAVLTLILSGTLGFIYLPFLFQLVTRNLGIPIWLSVITVLLCLGNFYSGSRSHSWRRLNLPIYVIFTKKGRFIYQPWLWWWLRNHRKKKLYIPKHGVQYIHKYVPKYFYINIIGGIVPVAIACWQFSRVSPLQIVLLIAITTPIFYLWVKVVANYGVLIPDNRIWQVALIVAISTVWLGDRSSAGAIAYAGITWGSLIGSDLLHLKDLNPAQASVNFSIGGAGMNDGLVSSGLYALIVSEFIWAILPRLP